MPDPQLTPEARARLDAHLDAVESALSRGGAPRESRRAIVDDLESQLLEMLAARAPTGTQLTLADVEAVLSDVDPPAAYGGAGAGGAAEPAASVRPLAASRTVIPTPKRNQRRTLMKALAVVAMVVCGTALVLTPAVSDYFHQKRLAELLDHLNGNGSVNLEDPMEGANRFGFWFTGTLLIVGSVAVGLKGQTPAQPK